MHLIATFHALGIALLAGSKIVAQIIKLRLLLYEVHLIVGDGCTVHRIPVDHTEAAVNQPFLIQIAEHFRHRLGAEWVHRECGAVPVAGATQLAKLLQDDTAVVVSPVPGMLQELLTSKVGFLYALSSQLGNHLGFGGNGSVVGAGHPAGVLALHTGAAHQDILDSLVEHMPHMEHTGNVWRRDNHGIRLA